MDPTASQPRSPPLRHASRLYEERRIVWFSLLASVLFHLLVLFLLPPFHEPSGQVGSEVRIPSSVAREFGIGVIQPSGDVALLDAVEHPEAPAPGNVTAPPPVAAEPLVVEGAPEVRTESPAELPTEPAAADDERPSVAERLLPQMVDPRLWAPVELVDASLTDEERAQLLLSGMIRSWNDSMAIALALSERATDWTYTDDQGRKWGLSPGRLHLGDFSIPLPFSFGGSMEQMMLRRRELEELEWIRQDLERARIQGEIQEVWAERARAIRERLEAERRQLEEESGEGP